MAVSQSMGGFHLSADTLALSPDEHMALQLVSAIRADAEATCAPDTVSLVSVTFDVSAPDAQDSAVIYEPKIDRRTRTILFTGGVALSGGKPVMKATAVYRIVAASA